MKFVKIDADSNFIALQQFTKPGFANGMYMQDFTASMCNNAPTPTGTDYFLIGTLKDKRDNKQYEVRKFADGKCWMVDNLAYGGDTASGGVDGCLKTTFDGRTNSTPTNIFGVGTYGDCRYPYDDITTPDTHKYGYLYNWQAVTQNAQAHMGSDYQPTQPTQGICPSGWHVPSGGTGSEYEQLVVRVGTTNRLFWLVNGWRATLAGFCWHYKPCAEQGISVAYYTSTQNGDEAAFGLRLGQNGVFGSVDNYNNVKTTAISVRCVKDTQEPILFGCTNPTSTMQAWHGCSTLTTPTGANFTQGPCLMDERDGKTYEVRKFADGKCWMVTNLAYGGDTRNGGVDGCMKTTFNGETHSIPTNVFGVGTYGDCRYPYSSVVTPDTNLYGYYYNWQAAVQDAQAYAGNNYQPSTPVVGLCPSGWRLPDGNGISGDFADLHMFAGATGNDFWLSPLGWQGVLAGSSVGSSNQNFWYWYGTQQTNNNAYNWKYDTVVHANNSEKTAGLSIRCLQD